VLRAIQADFTAFGDPAERLRRVGGGEGEMDLLDGGFGVELELVPDATELVLHRVVVPARQRLLHGSAPELVRDKREPVLSVWHGLRRDHPETVPIAFLELSLKSAGFLAHGTNRVWFVLSFLFVSYELVFLNTPSPST